MTYEIESIRTKDGDIHERELRRKGHRVDIRGVMLDVPLFATYIDDGDRVLVTSPVEAFAETTTSLVVHTRYSIYLFRKVTEVIAHST